VDGAPQTFEYNLTTSWILMLLLWSGAFVVSVIYAVISHTTPGHLVAAAVAVLVAMNGWQYVSRLCRRVRISPDEVRFWHLFGENAAPPSQIESIADSVWGRTSARVAGKEEWFVPTDSRVGRDIARKLAEVAPGAVLARRRGHRP
jgi:hypothetical protein